MFITKKWSLLSRMWSFTPISKYFPKRVNSPQMCCTRITHFCHAKEVPQQKLNLEQKQVSSAKLDIFVKYIRLWKFPCPLEESFIKRTNFRTCFATFCNQRMNVGVDDLAVYSILKTYPLQLRNGHLLHSILTYSTIFSLVIFKAM